jgi:ABC-type lipoprotein release transport system permease subunit
MLDGIAAAERAGKRLRRAFAGDDSLEILTWDQAMPEMAEFVWFKAVSGWVFVAVVILIVAIGVANTVFMSVMERTREFGVMRALGAGPGRIFGLVLAEGVLLGLLGVLIGLALATPMLHYLANTGIRYEKPVEVTGVAIDAVRAKATPHTLLLGCLGVLFVAVLASVFPALRAARLRVLKALHAA